MGIYSAYAMPSFPVTAMGRLEEVPGGMHEKNWLEQEKLLVDFQAYTLTQKLHLLALL